MKKASFLKILIYFVLPAHVILILAAWVFKGCSENDFEDAGVTSVELFSPTDEPAPALPEPDEPEPEIQSPDLPEPEPEPPKMVTRKIEPAQPLPDSNLKERLKNRLAEVKPQPQARARPHRSSRSQGSPGKSTSWYNSYIQQRMYSLWRQPSRSVVKARQATAIVGFRIYRDGHIEGIKLIRPSGNRIMDDSILEAVKMADPLIPPSDLEERYKEYELLFELKE